MPTELDALTLRCLRGAAEMTAGLGLLLLTVAERMAGPPEERESEEPAEGAALLGSELRCIVEDTIGPASERLEELIERWMPPAGAPERP